MYNSFKPNITWKDTQQSEARKPSKVELPFSESTCDNNRANDMDTLFSTMMLYIGVQIFVFTIIGIMSCVALLFYINDRRKSEKKIIGQDKQLQETKDSRGSSFFNNFDLSRTTNGTEKYYGDSILHCYSEDETDITRSMNHYYTDEVTGKKTHHPGLHDDFSCSSFATSCNEENIEADNKERNKNVKDVISKKEPHHFVNTYTETFKLAQNGPQYIDTYLDACFGQADNSDILFDRDDIDMNILTFDNDEMMSLTQEELVYRIEMLRFALSLEFNGSSNIFHQIVENHGFWTNLIESKPTNNHVRTAAFQLISDFMSYQVESEIMDSAIYLKFVNSMIQGIQYQAEDIQYGKCLRSLFAVLCSISIEDFIMACFDYWYDDRNTETSKAVEAIELEMLKLVLAKFSNQLIRDSKLCLKLLPRLHSFILMNNEDGNSQMQSKKQELMIIINALETATETENVPQINIASDTKNFKRRLSTSRKASSERPKKLRALGDIKNIVK